MSRDYVRQRVETADCILCLGAIMTDINLGGGTAQLDDRKIINANSEKVKIKHHFYHPIYLGDFIDGLIANLSQRTPHTLDIQPAANSLTLQFVPIAAQKISNRRFFQRLNTFLDDEFIVISDTGDAIVATIDLIMHKGADFIGQAFYLSNRRRSRRSFITS